MPNFIPSALVECASYNRNTFTLKIMKKTYIIFASLAALSLTAPAFAQTAANADAKAKEHAQMEAQAADYVSSLNLADTAKASAVREIVAAHLTAVRDWHNDHPFTLTPEGIDPRTGKVFTKLERQLIVDSTIPKTVHQDLMTGLRKYLTEEQVDAILDKYTIGKVAFTTNGYKAIVPNLTPAEENVIATNLDAAREEAVDYKQVKEMSIIFKIYKTRIEDYFNTHGRDWHAMYKTYVDKVLAEKAAKKKEKKS